MCLWFKFLFPDFYNLINHFKGYYYYYYYYYYYLVLIVVISIKYVDMILKNHALEH